MKKPVLPLFVALFAIEAGVAAQLPAQEQVQPPFAITIGAPHEIVKAGEDVLIHVTLKNVSDHQISVKSALSVECDFLIQVSSDSGRAANELGCDGSTIQSDLKPGDQQEADANLTGIFKFDRQGNDLVNVSKTFPFTSPGTYEIQLSRAVPDGSAVETLTSNKIAITVAPGDVAAQPPPLSITLSTPYNLIKLGDPIRVHVVLTNISDREITVPSPTDPAAAEQHYAYAVSGPKLRLFNTTDGGGPNLTKLKPGEHIEEDGTLDANSTNFTLPGDYRIQFFRGDGGDYRQWAVKSNIVTITLTE
jgi:hypothetical protein